MFKKRKGAFKWLFKNSKPIAGSIVLLTVLGVMVSYIAVEFALAAGKLLDVATTRKSADSFKMCVINIAVLLVLEVVLESFFNIYAIRVSSKNKNRLQRNLFASIMNSDYLAVSNYHSGELVNRLTADINIINSNIIDIIPAIIMLLTSVAFSFVAMFRLDFSFAVICLSMGPLVILTSALYGRKMKKLHKNCQESDGRTRSFMQESIQNLLVIKAFGREKRAENHTGILQNVNYKLNMKRGYISIMVNLLYYMAMTVAYYFAVSWCAYKISIGIMTVGTFTAIVQLVNSMQAPFKEISGTVSQLFATLASAERIMEIEEIQKDIIQGKTTEYFKSLEIKNIIFSYGDKNILKEASLTVNKGDITVIEGISGQGKSTFFKLLMGIYKPESGTMKIIAEDNEYKLSSATRSLFAYVPQGNMIVSGTIRDNIAFFADVSQEDVEKAARCAEIYDYIVSLPDGFDTVLGEGGLGLSEGQTQRLAVARALCTDSPIILLDEATSALDDATEAKILKNIKNLANKTPIIITHRAKAKSIANVQVYLENGKFERYQQNCI